MRPGLRLLLILASLGFGSNAQAQDSTCVSVRDRASQHAIATALVRFEGMPVRETWTGVAGRVCLPLAVIRNSVRVQAGALGYKGVSRDLHVGEAAEVLLERVVSPRSGGASDTVEWRQEQMAIAIALARRDVRRCVSLVITSCGRSYVADVATPADMSLVDSVTSVEARAFLRSAGLTFLDNVATRLHSNADHPPQLQGETSGITLVTFVDTPDSADRYTELRVGIPSMTGRASFGATEMICKATDCSRQRQISLTWNVGMDGELTPSMAIATDGRNRVDAFDLSVSSEMSPTAVAATRMAIVRGVVRDTKERPLNDAQILASPDGNDTRTDSTGRFLIQVAERGGGTVLTVRALGYAPAFRTVRATADSAISWEPRLRSVQLLAERVVRETGLPQELSSWRYDDMMARRAKGTGYFMIGPEIWSSSSIGDALNRVPGVLVKMRYGHTIDNIGIPRCSMQKITNKFIAPEDKIGVWVNGYEQTRNKRAEDVLEEISAGSVIAIEVYRGLNEIPAEFATARYCGVISVWTR